MVCNTFLSNFFTFICLMFILTFCCSNNNICIYVIAVYSTVVKVGTLIFHWYLTTTNVVSAHGCVFVTNFSNRKCTLTKGNVAILGSNLILSMKCVTLLLAILKFNTKELNCLFCLRTTWFIKRRIESWYITQYEPNLCSHQKQHCRVYCKRVTQWVARRSWV